MFEGRIHRAFVLGAGLGTRLRPLTEKWPKPLVPVFQKPLITFAMDQLISAGISRLAVNTHHAAAAYDEVFPQRSYQGAPIEFRHEDPVLETGGGIKNLEDWIGDETIVVYNGDILSDVPLDRAAREHFERGNCVTLVLRSGGGPAQVAWDPGTGLVTDIRNARGTNAAPLFLFTGVYLVSPSFLREIPAGEKISVVPIWLRMIEEGKRVGAVVEDSGQWWDLGNRSEYLKVHWELRGSAFPCYPIEEHGWNAAVHHTAVIAHEAKVRDSVVGRGVVIESGAEVKDSIIWPGARIESGARLRGCIVRHGVVVNGEHRDEDL